MATDSKVSPARLKRLTALLEAGESVRAIASSLDVNERTVRRWMAERGLESTRRPGAPRKAERAKAGPATLTPAQLAAEVTKAEAALGEPGGSRELIRRELAAITVHLALTREAMTRGETSGAVYERLTNLQRGYAHTLKQLEPPPEQDPERDPTNLEAADRVLRKLRRLVTRAEAETVCRHCGRAPF